MLRPRMEAVSVTAQGVYRSPGKQVKARGLTRSHVSVTELSLQGCFLETSASFEVQRSVVLKIYDSGEYFETKAIVLYVRSLGHGTGVSRDKTSLSSHFAEADSHRVAYLGDFYPRLSIARW